MNEELQKFYDACAENYGIPVEVVKVLEPIREKDTGRFLKALHETAHLIRVGGVENPIDAVGYILVSYQCGVTPAPSFPMVREIPATHPRVSLDSDFLLKEQERVGRGLESKFVVQPPEYTGN